MKLNLSPSQLIHPGLTWIALIIVALFFLGTCVPKASGERAAISTSTQPIGIECTE